VGKKGKRSIIMRDISTNGEIVGRPTQTVNEESVTQKYPIGTIFDSFGKRHRYCRAQEAITPARRGSPALIFNTWYNSITVSAPQFGTNGSTATGNAGDNYVICSFGADYDVARAKDLMYDGILSLFDSAGLIIDQYRITGNEATYQVSSADDTMKVYIDPPLARAAVAVPVDGLPSPYNFCGDGGSVGTAASVICVNPIVVSSGYYFWGQTRGPAWVTPNAGWTTAATRECEWHTDGTIKAAAGVAIQRAGYLLAHNSDADDAHIFLQLE
jgi:uncharacterized membrane protein